jgi:hypothetical protein
VPITATTYRGIGRTLAVLMALALALLAPSAAQARSLETILQDDAQFLHRSEEQLRRSLEELKLLGVDRLRVTAGWSVLTRDPDGRLKPLFDAADPAAYEQERWRNLDRVLTLASEYGIKTMVDIAFWAPKWASVDGPTDRGRTHIDPGHFREFALAVARRYSGSFLIPGQVGAQKPLAGADQRYLDKGFGTGTPSDTPPVWDQLGVPAPFGDRRQDPIDDVLGTGGRSATRPLPKVEMFTLWNEPNHTGFLRPQWVKVQGRWRPSSPHRYRAMVQLAYPAMKASRPDATILIGGTSFNGVYANKGVGGVPPLRFLREMACVDNEFKPLRRDGCDKFKAIQGDGWSHHPYSMMTTPGTRNRATRPDDAPIAELPALADTLDRLVKMGRLSPANRQIWVTEYGYETNPPDRGEKYSQGDQARFLPWAEYLAWRVPSVQSFAQFLLRDLPGGAFRVGTSKKRAFGEWQSGLLTEVGENKPGFRHFRAGIFVERADRGRLRIFGRLRLGTGARTVVIETLKDGGKVSGYRALTTLAPGAKSGGVTFSADADSSFLRFARAPGGPNQRYRIRIVDGGGFIPLKNGVTAAAAAVD